MTNSPASAPPVSAASPRLRIADRAVLGSFRRIVDRVRRLDDETGDVPGWVLITLMTAGLVLLIWGIAGPALSTVFEQAISRVSSI